MSEQKQKIGFTVACVDEFARQHNLSAREAFCYLFQFKGIAFIKEKARQSVFGFDISKEMIKLGAKKYKDVLFFVGNISKIPVSDCSCDIGIHICAPFCEKEFARILKKDGYLLSAVPGKKHLIGLKEILYENVYENEVTLNERTETENRIYRCLC